MLNVSEKSGNFETDDSGNPAIMQLAGYFGTSQGFTLYRILCLWPLKQCLVLPS